MSCVCVARWLEKNPGGWFGWSFSFSSSVRVSIWFFSSVRFATFPYLRSRLVVLLPSLARTLYDVRWFLPSVSFDFFSFFLRSFASRFLVVMSLSVACIIVFLPGSSPLLSHRVLSSYPFFSSRIVDSLCLCIFLPSSLSPSSNHPTPQTLPLWPAYNPQSFFITPCLRRRVLCCHSGILAGLLVVPPHGHYTLS